ncbi:MAG TPA: SRPBCC family protein [Chloroflexota bacterium]|nr:SRPBCC family protein [Chloroflexota bacterium]
MSKPEFIYVTYIETTPEELWKALTDGDFTERYWFAHRAASDWNVGSSYQFTLAGEKRLEGKVLISDPPRKLSYSWNGCSEEFRRERTSRVTFDLEPRGKVVKLTLTHDNLDEAGVTLRGISDGWPMVLASLKSLLETGRPLPNEVRANAAKEEVGA